MISCSSTQKAGLYQKAKFVQRSRIFMMMALVVSHFVMPYKVFAQQQGKLVAYYPMWAQGPLSATAIPPWEIDWQGLTHVIHFYNGSTVNPSVFPYFRPVISANDSLRIQYWYTDCGVGCYPVNYQDSLIIYAHRNGVKVLLDIQDVVPTNMNVIAADSIKSQALVDASVAYIQRKGYDGIEIDIESWSTPPSPLSGYQRLIRLFRQRLNQMNPVGLFAISPSTGAWNDWSASQNNLVDMYLLQCYEYEFAWNSSTSQNVNWYLSPLFTGASTPPSINAKAWNTLGAPQWVANGHDPAKLVPGMPTYGRVLIGQDSLFKPWGGNLTYSTLKKVLALRSNGGTERWDDERKVPSIGGTAITSDGTVNAGQKYFATYENPQSVEAKVNWVNNQGYGGLMIYDFTMDLDHTKPFGQRNPLIKAARDAMRGTDTTQATGTFSASADTLPAGGGSVTLSWTSSNATSASINQGIGSVALNGSQSVTIGSTTTFTLTLSNTSSTTNLNVTVAVRLPGGQGLQDVTMLGSTIALIPNPTGGGNPNIEVIRDGVTPPVGGTNAMDQYDTYTGGAPRAEDWIGYQFSSTRTFSRIVYQEGLDNQWGGCFNPLGVEVRRNGQWLPAQNISFSPAYPGSNAASFETYEINFTPEVGDAIRIIGPPTGTGYYIGVAELRVFDNGVSGTGTLPDFLPKDFGLDQNYPNPFNPETKITYHLPESADVVLKVFNMLGQEVATLFDGLQPAGTFVVPFSGANLANGIYFYSISANGFRDVRRMVLLK